MNFSNFYFTVLFVVSILFLSAQQPRYDRVRIHLDNLHTIRLLASLGVETDHGDMRRNVSFTSDFSEHELQVIANAGFVFDVLINDVSNYYANQNNKQQSKQSLRDVSCNASTGYNVQTPVNFQTGSMGGFYTYQEMLDVLDSMNAKYPGLISARQPIDTFHSIEGRPIYWLRISNHPDSSQTGKPQILYTALHHAREPAGLTDMIFYMWYLLENYQSSDEVKALVDNTEMFIVPCVNPDGYIYNETTNPSGGGLWRKNRRLNQDATYGVDLNRNYGYNWGYDNIGSSDVTTDETYRGTSGFSESETQAMQWFSLQHQFKIAVNYHTYSNMLVYPWGYLPSFLTPDSLLYEAYAETMTNLNGFLYGTGDQTVGYTTNGDSDDWMYGEQVAKDKIISMTPESGSPALGFWPPASEVINVCKENFNLIYSAHQFLLKYLLVKDESPPVVLNKQFLFSYQAQRLGFDSTGVYTISLASSDTNVIVPATVKTISQPTLLAVITDSFLINLNPSIAPGASFTFVVQVNNGMYTYADTITKKYISGDTLYYNNCNSIAAFTPTGTWGVTTASYTSPTGSITDSPDGVYADNTDATVTLNNTIDLTHATYATLLFEAKWQLEKGYDYTLIEASSDSGATWNALCGQYTNTGKNINNPGQPLYDGYQLSWVQEAIGLSDYIGAKVNLRFHLVSDEYVHYDGFYFDDLTVLGKLKSDTSQVATAVEQLSGKYNWQIFPNPAADIVTVRPFELNGEEVTIVNTLGAEVRKTRIAGNQLSLIGLAPGVYFLTIRKNGFTGIQKLIITR